jgi:hypothetical protein
LDGHLDSAYVEIPSLPVARAVNSRDARDDLIVYAITKVCVVACVRAAMSCSEVCLTHHHRGS